MLYIYIYIFWHELFMVNLSLSENMRFCVNQIQPLAAEDLNSLISDPAQNSRAKWHWETTMGDHKSAGQLFR